MDISYQDKTNIPNISSIFVASYLKDFIDWDMDLECYVSKNDKKQRPQKDEEIAYMYDEDAILHNPSIKELEFLFIVEQDQIIKKMIYNLIKFWKKKRSN